MGKRGVRTVSDFQRYDPEKIVEISHESKCKKKETLNTVLRFRRHLFISHASNCEQSWYSTSIKSNILRTRIKEFDAIFNWGFKGGLSMKFMECQEPEERNFHYIQQLPTQ